MNAAHRKARAGAIALLIALAGAAAAQSDYPSRPVRILVPFPPGASNDTVARAVAYRLIEPLGQQMVVDNRGGAGGAIGAAILARALADGYTLMVTSTSYATSAAVQAGLPFDPLADVAGVALIGRGPMMVVVAPTVPARSIGELVALARSQRGEVTYTSSGIGSAPHLATELFLRQAGIEMLHVPHKGLGPALIDLGAGRVQVLIASLPSVLPHVKAARLRGLAVTSAQRSAFAQGLPTVAEAGVPGYTSELWWGLFAPARTPPAIVEKLNVETRRLLAASDMKQLLANAGAEPGDASPSEFDALVKSDIAKWRKLVRERRIRQE